MSKAWEFMIDNFMLFNDIYFCLHFTLERNSSITSAKEIMFSVAWFVCLFVSNIAQKVINGLQ